MPRTRRPSAQTIALLSALAARPSEWRHGYELCQEVALPAGTVYPILIRLAERGLMDAEWEQPTSTGRPARHLYRISSAGAEYLTSTTSAPVPSAALALRPRPA